MLTFQRIPKIIITLALLITSSMLFAAPQTITDIMGRKVTVNIPAKRVVVGFNFEEFTAITGTDGWNRVVGISKTGWAGWRSGNWAKYVEAIPRLNSITDVGFTDDNTFSAEKVIALQPDVVLLPVWSFAALGPALAQFNAAGIPVVVIDYNDQTLAHHLASTRLIGTIMGTSKRANELATLYQSKYQDIQRRIALAKPIQKPKVYVELGRDGATTIGNTYRDTMWGRIIDLLGANNIANGKLPAQWGPLNPEQVLASDPDFIFIAGSSWTNRPNAVRLGYQATEQQTRTTLQPYAQRQGWNNLSAVKQHHVYAIDHGLCRALVDFTVMEFIAKQLYPAQFKDVNPEADLRQYHQKYLPVNYSGSWMVSLKP